MCEYVRVCMYAYVYIQVRALVDRSVIELFLETVCVCVCVCMEERVIE